MKDNETKKRMLTGKVNLLKNHNKNASTARVNKGGRCGEGEVTDGQRGIKWCGPVTT